MTEAINLEASKPPTLEEKIAKSSQVAALGYDAEKQTLQVEFRNSGFVYIYDAFPPDKYAELIAADSLGSYLYRNVTGGKGRSAPFGFTKVDKATGEIIAQVAANA